MFSLTPGRARIGGRPVLPDPVGVSGITMIGNDLLVANTMKSLIVSVRVRPNGMPGNHSVLVQGSDKLAFPDGLASDRFGNLYAAVPGAEGGRGTVVQINLRSGDVRRLAAWN